MNVTARRSILRAVAIAATLLLAACASTPQSEFFVLTPIGEGDTASPPNANSPSVGVGPVVLPEYLDRPNIVTRSAPNRLQVDEFHRWGGSLKDDLLRVSAQNLALLLGTGDVATYPWDDPVVPDYRVRIEIHRFDGDQRGYVELDARWLIVSNQRDTAPVVRRSLIREPTPAGDHAALARACSLALASMAREMAAALRELHGKN